jgi:hypothetical protein
MHPRFIVLTALAAVLAGGVLGSARAAAPCGSAVFDDWLDGRIEHAYAPRCYRQALDGLPEDVRTYSTAREDIERALLGRVRKQASAQKRSLFGPSPARAAAGETAPSSSGSRPAAAALLAGGLAVAATAGVLLARRRRT